MRLHFHKDSREKGREREGGDCGLCESAPLDVGKDDAFFFLFGGYAWSQQVGVRDSMVLR